MVVVLLIGIVAVLAIPNMITGRDEGHVYHDASQIAELLRVARARALGREAAVAVLLTSSNAPGGADLGTFTMMEATTSVKVGGTYGVANATVPLLAAGTPSTSCGAPTVWPTTAAAVTAATIDGVNMNGKIEQQAFIFSTINNLASGTATPVTTAWICYTPLGRAYLSFAATPAFTTGSPMLGVLQVDVNRSSGGSAIGITRSVIIPPSGAARIYSH